MHINLYNSVMGTPFDGNSFVQYNSKKWLSRHDIQVIACVRWELVARPQSDSQLHPETQLITSLN